MEDSFLTGHLGFKGEWLVRLLVALGGRVIGYSLAPTHVSVATRPIVHPQVSHQLGDVLDHVALRQAVRESGATIAFHLAAQPLVRVGHAQPAATFMTNVMGTVNFLEAVGASPSVQAAVVVTSDKVYRPRIDSTPHCEGDELGGDDPYGASKACAELVCRAYAARFRRTGGPAIATVRAGNVIGGGDWSVDRLVPDLARAVSVGRTLTLRRPGATRPWQHVTDPVRGYVRVARALLHDPTKSGSAWNFGPLPTETLTVAQVVDAFVAAWGKPSADFCVEVGHDAMPEADVLKIDSSRAHAELGWHSAYDVHRAITATADWYRAHQQAESHSAVLAGQVAQAAEIERTWSLT